VQPALATYKGEMMKNVSMKIALALVGVATMGMAARANLVDQLTVTVPFEFVANGVTLPAGQYRVQRISDIHPSEGLVLTNFDKRKVVLVFPVDMESPREIKPELTFENGGDHAVLTRIQTAQHVFNFRVPKDKTTTILADSGTGTHASK
jgi:hypothetical protein